MSFQPRFLERFESSSGSIVLTLPVAEYEWETEQGLWTPESVLTGGDYGYDMLGVGIAKKQSAIERLRFVIYEDAPTTVDTKVDEFLDEALRIGRGKLWTIDSGGVERWAYARLLNMPSLRWAAGDILRKTLGVNFRRNSDWFAESAVTQTLTVSGGTPESIVINNTGTARNFGAVLTIKGTFTDPVITNLANNYQARSLRDGSAAGHWLRFDCARRRVEFSDDSGTFWDGDYANFVRTPPQTNFMVLEPGNNTIGHEGTISSGSLTVTFYPAFH